MGAVADTLELLVTVKAYPNPSEAVGEAACIAGISRIGKWVRLYPVPFRDLEDEQQFHKYQWIEARVKTANNDRRPETYRPVPASIRTLGEPLPATHGWAARRDIVLPLRSPSMCDIQDAQRVDRTSLGIFRPREILDLEHEEESPRDWTPAERQKLNQGDLLTTSDKTLLEKIPVGFYYRYRCENCRTSEPHRMKVLDWELAQLWRRLRRGHDETTTIDHVRKRFLHELCAPTRDTHFFTGNMQAHPQSFLVLGVFWPERTSQGDLFVPR